MATKIHRFWDLAWKGIPNEVGASVVRAYHNETCRLVAAMPPGPVKDKANDALRPSCPGAASLTDDIDNYLGEPAQGVRHRRQPQPRSACGFAIQARRAIYVAEVSDPAYADLDDDRLRVFFRRCTVRAEHTFLEALEAAAGVSLGRP